MERFAALMRNFSQAPDAAAIVQAFADLAVDQSWRAETVLVLPVFLALVLDGAPDQGIALVERVQGGHAVKVEVVAQALNYCHLPDRARLMERLVGEAAAAAMEPAGADFKAFVPSHPVHVDMLWACLFATGDAEYAQALVRLLQGWVPPAQAVRLLDAAKADDSMAATAMAALLAQAAQGGLAQHGPAFPQIRQALALAAQRQDGVESALAARLLAGFS